MRKTLPNQLANYLAEEVSFSVTELSISPEWKRALISITGNNMVTVQRAKQ